MRRELGRLIARGNTSDVYEWSTGAVIKILRSEIPPDWAEAEASATHLLHEAGLPVPAVYDLLTIGRRPGIVFQRIHGDTMQGTVLGHPEEAPQTMGLLLQLQTAVNAARGPAGLRSLKDRLRTNIGRAERLSPAIREEMRGMLNDMPDGDHVCHFDFHPNNVIAGRTGPVIIDWFDASAGDPAADIVRTSLLLCHGPAETYSSDVAERMTVVHREYLAQMMRVGGVDVESLLRWEPVILAARLAEPLPDRLLGVTHRDLLHVLTGRSPLRSLLRECKVAA